MNGNIESSSNDTAYQGSTGGGGGYYGGQTQYAGTSYTREDFSEVTTTQGAREGNGYVKITLIESYPEVSITASTKEFTNQDITLTAIAKDDIVGLKEAPYSWNGGARTASNTSTVTKNGTYTLNAINNHDYEETASITISNIDKINPVVNSIDQSISSNKRQTTLTIQASDTGNNDYAASGVNGYAVTMTDTPPEASKFQSSNSISVNKNGTYYAWAKDKAGNISKLNGGDGSSNTTILVKDLEIEVGGNITWNDHNNQYNARKESTIHLYRKIGENGTEEKLADFTVEVGETTSFSIQTRECDDNGNQYIFRVEEDYIEGYEPIYEGNSVTSNQTQNVTINVRNDLILPEYTSKIEYRLIDDFRGEYLKGTKLEMTATIESSKTNKGQVGVNQSKVAYLIDEGFTIDKNNLTIIYTDGETGEQSKIEDYIIQENNLIIEYGKGENHITKPGDKLTITIQGEFSKIKPYDNSITLIGNLTDYKGTNTNIDLGQVTRYEKNFEVKYQKPVGKLEIQKTDSITEEKLRDAEFTLYEWDGTKYVEKETLKDEDQDGIYTSEYYKWNPTTQGKYKVVETKVPENHRDTAFSMEFVMEELHEDKYTISPDYNNANHRIAYKEREPDDLDKATGIVENEPYKIKASINNIDSQTKKVIENNAIYTIYEWNKETGRYEEYISKTNGKPVTMQRKEDKTYEASEWLYYTKTNEGKYKVVETTPAVGYYGDYEEQQTNQNSNQENEQQINQNNKQKREYEINILDAINQTQYGNQTVENESTIVLFNNEDKTSIESKRVETDIDIQLIDNETKKEEQGNGTFAGVEYEIYAKEQINHADGTTTRYVGEPGVLYKQNELVKIENTNEQGNIQIDDLECGSYRIKQHTIPTGYLMDETTYEIDVNYRGQEIKIVEAKEIYENTVKKQAFQILKQQTIGIGETAPLANAGFTIYEIEELSIVREGKITRNEDGTYTLNDEEAKQEEGLTNKANSNGSYNIGDLVNYYYKIHYTEENKEQLPQSEHAYHPYNLKGENLVKDYEKSEEGEEIQEIITNKDGYVKSPELAYGEYIVIETSVPHEKEVIVPITIKVENDSREPQSLRYITDPNFKAKLKIYTKDNKTKETILQGKSKFLIKNKDTGEFITHKSWNLLEGNVEYGTYEKPFETNDKGYIKTPMNLELGTYEIIQLEAPEGYVLSGYEGHSENGETIKTPTGNVTLQIATNQIYYVDSDRENNIIVGIQENQAQVGTIKITNTGDYYKQTTQNGNIEYETKGIKGATYHIIAKEDIQSKDGQTKLYNKDDLVKIVTTNEEGKAYAENLPQGKYTIKQVDKGEGFSLNEEEREINITYGTNKENTEEQPPQKTPVTYYEENYKDDTTKLEVELIDQDTGKKLEDIEMELYHKKEDGTEELIQKYTTGKNNFYIERIPVGNYIIRQPKGQDKLGKQGYVTNKDVEVTLEAKAEIQKVTIKQPVTILIIKGGEDGYAPGTEIEVINKETGEVVKEVIMGEGDEIIEKLPEGEYIIHVKDVDYDKGYIRGDDNEIIITDAPEGTILQHKQDYTKVEISLLDIDTKEPVIGGTLVVTNKEGKEVTESWITNGKPHRIDKLPIGEYYLVQTSAPTLKGYVRTEKIAFEVKAVKEVQTIEMLQDYTRMQIIPKDEDTEEEIKGIETIIKDDKGNEVGKVTIGENEEETNNILNRLPVGDYTLESTKVPYGYKPIHQTIQVKDKQGLQGTEGIKVEKEEFDLNVETIVQEIKRNDKVEYKKKEDTTEQKQEEAKQENNKQQTHKVDIKDKKIKTEQIEVTYQIKVSNQKKITGQVGRVEVTVPAGMEFRVVNNKTYWKEEGGKVVTEGLKGRDIKEGEKAEIPLILNWKNGLENFGTKKIQVEIKEVTSDIGFKETNLENNKSESEEIIIGVSTGEMNLVYMCWILLAILILAEIYLSKKTNIKTFKIKDKTIKGRK